MILDPVKPYISFDKSIRLPGIPIVWYNKSTITLRMYYYDDSVFLFRVNRRCVF